MPSDSIDDSGLVSNYKTDGSQFAKSKSLRQIKGSETF
jgi:hypothetical protein